MTESGSKAESPNLKEMFNAIASRYDLLNHILSFGADIRWRKRAVRILREKRDGVILDIASGSGDFSFEILEIGPKSVIASDFAPDMLKVFRKKLRGRDTSDLFKFILCDALHLPFKGETFDATVIGFGIRNIQDKITSLEEMLRVLKPNGVSVILELTVPRSSLILALYNFYTGSILPLVGKFISRHSSAYRYLPESISGFPESEKFLAMMKTAGFGDIKIYPMTFGIATIYTGRKYS